MWLVGDEFVKDLFPALQGLHQAAKINKTTPPYLYEYYNVFGYYSPSTTTHARRVIARVLNSFIYALNTRDCLPRFLVVILDKDLVNDVNVFGFGVGHELKANMKWLVKQIEVTTRRKRLELSTIKPGAVYGSDPKVIFVNMLRRPMRFPGDSKMDQILSVCGKFNQVLNELTDDFGYNMLSMESCDSPKMFDAMGNLNNDGKEAYCRELNDLLAWFDKKKVKLLPCCNRSSSVSTSSSYFNRVTELEQNYPRSNKNER